MMNLSWEAISRDTFCFEMQKSFSSEKDLKERRGKGTAATAMRPKPRRLKRQQQQLQNKRIEVVDDEGWTHITTGAKRPNARSQHPVPAIEDRLVPAEIPDGLSFESLKDRFEWHKRRWTASAAWDAVKTTLEGDGKLLSSVVDNCVCMGLGSPSGLLRGGLVDRRSISLFQLAALVSILEVICKSSLSVGGCL
jgi:hypothetical protein